MKKSLLVAVLILAAASLFAQNGTGAGAGGDRRGAMMGPGPGMMGPEAFGPRIDWKDGVSVLQEYKKSTGVLNIGTNLAPTFKADGVEYVLLLPRNAATQLNVKSGDTVTFEGVVTTVKGAGDIKPTFRVLKATVGGKVIDLTPPRQDGGPNPFGPGGDND